MTAILLGLLSQYLVPIILGGAALVGMFFARRSGVKAERAKQAQAELRAREKADEVEDAIAGRSAGENRERLRTWGRK